MGKRFPFESAPFGLNGISSSKVPIVGGQVSQRFVIAPSVAVVDKVMDLALEFLRGLPNNNTELGTGRELGTDLNTELGTDLNTELGTELGTDLNTTTTLAAMALWGIPTSEAQYLPRTFLPGLQFRTFGRSNVRDK